MLGMMEAWVAAHPKWRFYAVEGRRSWTVSALQVPPGRSGRAVAQAMKAKGWTIGTGLDALADAMIRIGHMGDLAPEHFAPLLATLDEVVR
jgi:aspartate aminotransferase-like enzyme